MEKINWKQNVRQIVRDQQIHTVRVCFQDVSNVQRARFVPIQHFLESTIQEGISCPSALYSLDTAGLLETKAGPGFSGGYPNWILKPDLTTFNVLPYETGMARVIADVYRSETEQLELSPRYVLQKTLHEFEKLGYRVYGAFEYEFYVFTKDEAGLKPIWSGLQCFSENKQAAVQNILNAILFALSSMGAGPEVANSEHGPGQFEITNSPFWGVEIADMAFYYRTSIREILQKQGLLATFMSKPLNSAGSGSGAHMNHSLFDAAGQNLFYDKNKPDGISDICRWFIGGQLHHARSLCALCNPTINSYKRLKPYSFAPASISWGFDHRGALIRIPSQRGNRTRLENRLPGADTNPYITLAAILAAGLDGIQNKIEPPAAAHNQDTYSADFPPLPGSLGEALAILAADPWVQDVMGAGFMQYYLSLRASEWQRFLQHVTDWEMQEYLELF